MSALTPYAAQGLRAVAPQALLALSRPSLPSQARLYNSSSRSSFRHGRPNWNDDKEGRNKPMSSDPQKNSLNNDIKINFKSRPDYTNDRGSPLYFMDTLAWTTARATFGVYDIWNRKNNSGDRVDANRRIRWLKTMTATPALAGAVARQAWSMILGERNDAALTKTLTNEFNNDRMHLLYAFDLAGSTMVTRAASLFTQYMVASSFAMAYFLSPRFVHRYLAHLQHDAMKSYDRMLKDPEAPEIIDTMKQKVSQADRDYWNLPEGATVEDLLRTLREDAERSRNHHHSLADDNAGIGSLGSIRN